jgi:hypothetical protein
MGERQGPSVQTEQSHIYRNPRSPHAEAALILNFLHLQSLHLTVFVLGLPQVWPTCDGRAAKHFYVAPVPVPIAKAEDGFIPRIHVRHIRGTASGAAFRGRRRANSPGGRGVACSSWPRWQQHPAAGGPCHDRGRGHVVQVCRTGAGSPTLGRALLWIFHNRMISNSYRFIDPVSNSEFPSGTKN